MVEATNAAKELAAERGVDLSTVEGTGSNGSITKDDVEKASRASNAPDTEGTAQQKQNAEVTEAQMDRDTQSTRTALTEEGTTTVRFRQNPPHETQLSAVEVGVNGVVYRIQRGVPVEIPESVAQVIEDARNAGREDLY